MKKHQTSLLTSLSNLARAFLKHSSFIVVIILLVFLAASIFSVASILERPSDAAYRSQQQSTEARTSFDQTTIERIKSLQTTSQSSNDIGFSISRQRQNPFTETPY